MSTKKKAAKKVTRKRGRTSKFTPDVARKIIAGLSEGIPLTVICRAAGMPHPSKVREWMVKDERFSGDIARARQDGFDALAAQCIEIADDEQHDWKLSKKGMLTDEVAIGRARLRVDTRLKLLAKWDPKRYGEKLDLQHSGSVEIEMSIGGDDAE